MVSGLNKSIKIWQFQQVQLLDNGIQTEKQKIGWRISGRYDLINKKESLPFLLIQTMQQNIIPTLIQISCIQFNQKQQKKKKICCVSNTNNKLKKGLKALVQVMSSILLRSWIINHSNKALITNKKKRLLYTTIIKPQIQCIEGFQKIIYELKTRLINKSIIYFGFQKIGSLLQLILYLNTASQEYQIYQSQKKFLSLIQQQ
ncbi:unnamed protein product [Paramecium sonneborni]|uniref:Uncharacterized protein n=1 Tax=Paramecium sonneborni TaxID=65129 RepID=A0A8S1RUF5_9CILI|nr:unnamed protein product [Paramecium sonneborni]